jgi:hypothetical protein
MLTRRDAVLGGMLTIVFGVGCACRAQAAAAPRYYGCRLPEGEVGRYYKAGTDTRLFVTGSEPMIARSGDSDFDMALAQTLARIAELFSVLPGFAYYDDHEGANAYATDAKRLDKADGTVLFGQRLLKRLMSGNDSPDAAVAAVCAHEFGHIVQFKKGLDKSLKAGEATNKRIELQADYFAGFFAGVRKLQRPSFPAAVFALTQFNSGDNMINNPDHHGTHEERGAAVSRGFESAFRLRHTFSQAINESVRYVSSVS